MREEFALLKIGDFARIGQVSIATLRYYDQYNLLKPNALDPDSGYRYYSLDQLPRLQRILALKELGFALEQIASLLEEELSLEQLQGMFRLKQMQTQRMIEVEQGRLVAIAARLRQIELEGKMPVYEVVLKQVEPVLVASMREFVPIGEDIARAYEKVAAYLEQQRVPQLQPALLLLHSRYEQHDDELSIDVETAIPIVSDLSGNEQITSRTLPSSLVACTIHTGDALSLGRAHLVLSRWQNEHGYQLIDCPRLVYHQSGRQRDSSQSVTEVQFPVRKQ